MSCDSNSRLFSRVRAGISGLSGKQAFAAGMMAGVAGTGLAAMLMAQRRRLTGRLGGGRRNVSGSPQKPSPKPLPGLETGMNILPNAKPIPTLGGGVSSPPKARPIPGLSQTASMSNSLETKLQAAAVQIRDTAGQKTTLNDSYRVLQADGADTGLAITPYQAETNGSTRPGWSVTHAASGTLIDGPFDSPPAAQALATKLASLRWTATPVPAADISRAKTIVAEHQANRSNR